MEHTTLGRTGLDVSEICFGCWQLSDEWGPVERDDAIEAIRRARELGVTFFDTAQAYGFGASEKLLADALGDGIGDDELTIATKGGLRPTDDGGVRRDSSPEWIRQGVEESLEHLGLEAIDLYQVHWPDPDVPFEETAGALDELRDEGKIRHIGVSNFDDTEMAAFSETAKVETLQPPYHLFRRHIEDDILPWCASNKVGVMVYGPLAHGLLAGKLGPMSSFAEGDWRQGHPMFTGTTLRRNVEVVENLRGWTADHDMSLVELAVAWTLARKEVDVAIVGARTAEHIEGTAGASGISLSETQLGEIDDISARGDQTWGPTPED
ncbi:MAG: aldo/keto reductase [Solirubrobacterales bacterium]